jgi:hypothetical protein
MYTAAFLVLIGNCGRTHEKGKSASQREIIKECLETKKLLDFATTALQRYNTL